MRQRTCPFYSRGQGDKSGCLRPLLGSFLVLGPATNPTANSSQMRQGCWLGAEQVKISELVGSIFIGCDDFSLKPSLAANQQLSRPQAEVIWAFEAEQLSSPGLDPCPAASW